VAVVGFPAIADVKEGCGDGDIQVTTAAAMSVNTKPLDVDDLAAIAR